VDEAHNFGLKVAVHAHGPEGIKAAIRAGAASIEHGTLMDDEGRSLMKQHGTYLVPTLEVRECVGTNYPAEFVAKANEVLTAQLQNFRKAVTAGVKIAAFGTDLGGLGRAGKNGADLIAVRGDPLADVRLLENVAFVMKQGEIYKQD